MPHACIVAYAVTGPVKVNPRRRSSRDRFLEADVQEGMSAVLAGPVLAGASWPAPAEASAYCQTSAASPPGSACAAPALRIAASIFARLRTMPASPSSLATSAGPNADTAAMSNPQNAARKFSRLRRMVSQDRPAHHAVLVVATVLVHQSGQNLLAQLQRLGSSTPGVGDRSGAGERAGDVECLISTGELHSQLTVVRIAPLQGQEQQ